MVPSLIWHAPPGQLERKKKSVKTLSLNLSTSVKKFPLLNLVQKHPNSGNNSTVDQDKFDLLHNKSIK